MRSHGHTTEWEAQISVGRAKDAKSWYAELKDWWSAHKTAHHDAKLAALQSRWDAKREAVRVVHADAAAAMIVPEHIFSTTTAFSDLAL